jgi:CRP-like cAMP-binding protein
MCEFFLDSLKKYIAFDKEEENLLLSKVQLRRVQKKQWLVTPGEYCRAEHFVSKGCFRAYYIDDRGVQHITKFAPEGWWITDADSYFNGGLAKLYVEALEDGEVVVMHKAVQEELFETLPQLNKYFRLVYQKGMVNSCERVLRTISDSAAEHYIRFLDQYPCLDQRVPQYMIASYLGITPEFLSKIKTSRVK